MKKMDLDGGLRDRVGKDVSLKTPGRAYPYLVRLVQFIENKLPDVPHYYKGGFFIGEYTREPRYTQDVDMSIVELSTYERVKDVLVSFGASLVSEGTIGDYAVKSTTSERSSGGAKYYALDGSILFSIDIGFQEVPCATVALEIDEIGNVQVSTVEQMLSDKLAALFSPQRFRRAKDLYDAWHIVTTCNVDVNTLALILDKAGRFPLRTDDCPFAMDIVDQMEDAYYRLNVVDVGTNIAKELPAFVDVAHVLSEFWVNLTDAEV